MSRPTDYNEDVATRLLAAIATTNKGLQSICDSDESFPSPPTVYAWMQRDESFLKRYARAKEDQTQVLEDEIIAIADTPVMGEVVTDKGDKVEVRRGDMIEHRKLQIEARKWLMGKLRPKKYGDKIQHTGADGEGPVETSIAVTFK